jgi:hypothetical protein
MKHFHRISSIRAGIASGVFALAALCASANAQNAAEPAQARPPAPPPGLAQPPPVSPQRSRPPGEATRGRLGRERPPRLVGVVVTVRAFDVQIRTADDRYVRLQLHKGTIINPLGTTLAPGMNVAVRGVRQSAETISTDRIDALPAAPPQGRESLPEPGQRGEVPPPGANEP